MTQKTFSGVIHEVTEEGYLIEKNQYTKEIAIAIAQEENITLNDNHFAVIVFLRDKIAKGENLTFRSIRKSGIVDISWQSCHGMPNGWAFPLLLGIIPRDGSRVSDKMRNQMVQLDIPIVPEFLEKITAGGREIYVYKLAVDKFKLKKEDLSTEVSYIITIGEFYGKCGGQGTQIIFT